jgi:spore maturation protein CgeB
VFEALGCGSCLITPLVGHGLTDFFTPGEDLFTYSPSDMPGLISLLNHLLSVPELCETVAASGLKKVNAAHRAEHRAKTFTNAIKALPGQHLVRERLEHADIIRQSYLRLIYLLWAKECQISSLGEAYVKASRGEL